MIKLIQCILIIISNLTGDVFCALVKIGPKLFQFIRKRRLIKRKNYLDNNFTKAVEKPFKNLSLNIEKLTQSSIILEQDLEGEVARKSLNFEENLRNIQSVIDDNKQLMIGAIGEEKAVKVLQKLPESFVVINDFKRSFDPPIYRRKMNDYIKSIQLDHIVVGPPGIFLIETKYWSQQSIERLDLFSPVEQLRRSSYALFIMLNKAIEIGELRVGKHHWGKREIQIKNILLMIGKKPNERFQFIKIKSLHDIRNYITWFEPIFSEKDVKRITKFLIE